MTERTDENSAPVALLVQSPVAHHQQATHHVRRPIRLLPERRRCDKCLRPYSLRYCGAAGWQTGCGTRTRPIPNPGNGVSALRSAKHLGLVETRRLAPLSVYFLLRPTRIRIASQEATGATHVRREQLFTGGLVDAPQSGSAFQRFLSWVQRAGRCVRQRDIRARRDSTPLEACRSRRRPGRIV
jgi:hypothetical protein